MKYTHDYLFDADKQTEPTTRTWVTVADAQDWAKLEENRPKVSTITEVLRMGGGTIARHYPEIINRVPGRITADEYDNHDCTNGPESGC